MAKAIRVTPYSIKLDLGLNDFSDKGICVLIEAINVTHYPVTLDLKYNFKITAAETLRLDLCPLGTKITGLSSEIESLCEENDKRIILERQAGLALSTFSLLENQPPKGFSETVGFTVLAMLIAPEKKTVLT